jgi:hypothetical protein
VGLGIRRHLEKWNIPSGDVHKLQGWPETGAEDIPAMLPTKEGPQARVNIGDAEELTQGANGEHQVPTTKRRPADGGSNQASESRGLG